MFEKNHCNNLKKIYNGFRENGELQENIYNYERNVNVWKFW